MNLPGFLRTTGQYLDDMKVAYEVGQIIRSDRATGACAMDAAVKRLTAQQLAQFEIGFLKASGFGMFTPEERIRALELYAIFKVYEVAQSGQLQFCTATNARALA